MTAPTPQPNPSVLVSHLHEFPGNSALLLDYLKAAATLQPFYPDLSPQTLSTENLLELAPRIAAQSFDRATLVEVLTGQNAQWGSSETTQAAIKRLLDERTVAVVGGQQAGLFGGPLLSVYKALTLIRLAQSLTAAGQPTVPVFWIASEDHDFEEVHHTAVLTRDGARAVVRYEGTFATTPPVGALNFGSEVEAALEALKTGLPETEFTPEVLTALNAAYQSGAGWCDAFARWMTHLFTRFGLILVDPRDERLKRLAEPVIAAAVNHAPELAAQIVSRSEALTAAGYHAQVRTDANQSLVFLEIDGTRTALTQNEGRFHPKTESSVSYSAAQLLEIFATEPLRLTPNALLRPIIQDVLFPTVAQVIGPAELAYLAQSQPIYDHLQRVAPVRWVRSGLTLVERRHAKVFEKFHFPLIDVTQGETVLMRRVLTEVLDTGTADLFHETENLFTAQLEKLEQSLERSDPTLAKAMTQTREKIFYQLQHLQTRFLNSRAQAEDATKRQLERAVTALYPAGDKQERDLNLLSFLTKYGMELIDRMHAELVLDAGKHVWLIL
ncbi:MAG: bacillithiol biosynthesis cysteine-adding enzyme BshC [Blastocatellia bacterium]|nr:bacillithiol biosynthesis cysteine-adding enzyme BshC [Blastocatellia bacterium]